MTLKSRLGTAPTSLIAQKPNQCGCGDPGAGTIRSHVRLPSPEEEEQIIERVLFMSQKWVI